MSTRTDSLRRDSQALLDELTAAKPGCVISHKKIKCPFHDDRHPDNSIFEASDGVWRFKCWNGACGFTGDIFDVRAKRTCRDLSDVLIDESGGTRENTYKQITTPKESKKEKPRWFASENEIESAYPNYILEDKFKYHDYLTKEVVCIVYRFRKPDGKKHMPPFTPVDGGWLEKGIEGIRPVLNCAMVQESDSVIIVEGENKVRCLVKYGFIATCNMSGSNSAEYADWSILEGKRRITIWRDNDEAGLKWQNVLIGIFKNLKKPPTEIRCVWVEGLGLPEKGDVADLVKEWEAEKTPKETIKKTIEGIIRDAKGELTGSQSLLKYVDEVVAGLHKSIPWSHSELTKATNAFIPGTVTIIYGSPGSSKSLFLLQEAIDWAFKGIKFSILELEQNKNYHERRLMAIWRKDSRLTDHSYIELNAEEIKANIIADKAIHDRLSDCLHESPGGSEMSITDALKWIVSRFESGDRIVAVDPISACSSNKKPWVADKELINEAKYIADKYRGNIILISHTDKSGTMLMGGAALTRFSHCVLKLTAYPPDNYLFVSLKNNPTPCEMVVNRGLYIEKARDSWGALHEIAFSFNMNELNFYENGLVKKRKKQSLRNKGEQA